MDWFDLLVVQGTLQSLLQCHSSKASVLQCSVLFIVHLLKPYMTTWKTIALTRQNFVGKVMSLLFNMLSRLVITFLPRSRRLLISWLQAPSSMVLEPKKIKSVSVLIFSLSICYLQIWPWSTQWSRSKANRVLPRECTGHSKHLLSMTQENTQGRHQMVNTKTRWIIFFAAKDEEALYGQ